MSKTAKLGSPEATAKLATIKGEAIQGEIVNRSELNDAFSRNFANIITDSMIQAHNLGAQGAILLRRYPAFFKGMVDNLYRNHHYTTNRWTSYSEQLKQVENAHSGIKAEFKHKDGTFDAAGYKTRALNATISYGGNEQVPLILAAHTARGMADTSHDMLKAMIEGLEEGMNNYFAWADEKANPNKTGRERGDQFQKKFKYQPPEPTGTATARATDTNEQLDALNRLLG